MNYRDAARTLLGKLPKPLLYELFYQSARSLGIRSYEVNGSSGSFFGHLYDQSIIKPYLMTGKWSSNIVDLFLDFFGQEAGTMYDVGANIGLISVPISRLPNVNVLAFEPDPRNAALLRANLAVAGTHAEVVEAAVADKPGILALKRSEYNSGDHRLSSDGETSVPATCLDNYLVRASGRIGVKIDTQGAEPLILKGGRKVLANAGLIVSEFWPWGMARMEQEPDDILEFAESTFDRGIVLRHNQSATDLVPIGTVISDLRRVITAGGEYDAVDLVLVR